MSATTPLDPRRRIRPADLGALIPAGARVFLEQGACEPLTLGAALVDDAFTQDIQLVAAPVNGLNACDFGTRNVQRLNPVVLMSTLRIADAIAAGAVQYVPLHWSDVARAFRERYRPDVALIQVSPPDAQGRCHLGANASFEVEVALMARVVIAEVNPHVPRIDGDTWIDSARIDHHVEGASPLRALPPAGWGEVEAAIAAHVESLMPAACTLQIGPGRVPEAVLERLMRGTRRIDFHSGLLSDPMLKLAHAQRQQGHNPALVAGMLMGSTDFYRAAGEDPRIRLRNTAYTHSLAVMAGHDAFVCVNSAIEVDLLGQVNAERADGRQIAGVGGQVDFFRGARASPGGVSIVAMPSCTRTASRILPALPAGTPVSTSRNDVDYVVTEYGVAPLRNRSEGERVDALIAIAHPRHRDELRASTRRGTAPPTVA